MKSIKTNRTTLFQGKYRRFVLQGGWEFTERVHHGGVVVILPVTKQGKVILIDQYRIPVGKRVIEFPAGLTNDIEEYQNESMEEAAKRELMEETGYSAKKLVALMSGPASSGSSSDILTIYLAEGLKKVGEGGGDSTETITVYEVDLPEVEDWLQEKQEQGFFVDPKVYAGLYFLQKRKKKK